LRTHFSAAVQ